MKSNSRLSAYILEHPQLVSAMLSVAAFLLIDLAAIGLLRQIPNRITATWTPDHGEFLYSFQTEIIILIDLILFIVFFTIIHGLLKKMGFNDYEE